MAASPKVAPVADDPPPTERKVAPAQPEPAPTEPPVKAGTDERKCNVGSCIYVATVRGLCDEHWSTHRALADPED